MIFIDILLELSNRTDVKTWNLEQKSFIQKLIDKKIFNHDSPRFVDDVLKLADFFRHYFEEHGETPSFKEVANYLQGSRE